MLTAEGKIGDSVIENMLSWPPARRAYASESATADSMCTVVALYGLTMKTGLENLARYIIRASFSSERMIYIAAGELPDGIAKVIYQSKDGNRSKTFDAVDWLAQLVTHIPNNGEQMVRYYGFYSNQSRGLRKKVGTDDEVPALIDSDTSRKAFRKNWARSIQKIYKVDPLTCPKCSKNMKIISILSYWT